MIRKKKKKVLKRKTKPLVEINKTRIYTKRELESVLSNSYKQFCMEYCVNGWNATQAYLKAYPTASYNTAGSNGNTLLKDARIAQYVQFIKDDYEVLCGVSKARQIREYTKIAYSSIAAIADSWITMKDWDALIAENPTVLDAIESKETKTVQALNVHKELVDIEYIKIKMHPKIPALQNIDVLMGYKTSEKIDITGTIVNKLDLSQYTEEDKLQLLKLARKGNYTEE